ncbi:MAG: BolA/IbaG family iron-sulfur metabolism protein [Gammaproteobacteria bacterium]|nr:BolA/IbaG family iron-sulfur metabolism protein [Gammaproteobacteria bacterium]
MNTRTRIEDKLQAAFAPTFLEVLNESHQHNVPPGSESHFKVTVVSAEFTDRQLVVRHRMVNKTLAAELAGGVHALALHTLTPDEWFERAGITPDSPQCRGGATATGTSPKGRQDI